MAITFLNEGSITMGTTITTPVVKIAIRVSGITRKVDNLNRAEAIENEQSRVFAGELGPAFGAKHSCRLIF